MKQILKYILCLLVGFIIGFCVAQNHCNDIIAKADNLILEEARYTIHLGILNDSTVKMMNDSLETPYGQKYKQARDAYMGLCIHDIVDDTY